MSCFRKRTALIACSIFMVSVPVFGQSKTPSAGTRHTSPVLTDADHKASVAFWTEERRKAAKPWPHPAQMEAEKEAKDRGEAAIRPMASMAAIPEVRADVSVMPYSAGGKLFFRTADDKLGSCTAQVVGNDSVLLTAAHCVFDANARRWHTHIVFHRAYADGGGQVIPTTCSSIENKYYLPSINDGYDYSFSRLRDRSEGGHLGLAIGVRHENVVEAIGYPANIGKAKYMQKFSGSMNNTGAHLNFMMGNPMAEGASGGAWIRTLRSPRTNYQAVGLNSFGKSNANPNKEWSPLFDSVTQDLWDMVSQESDCKY